MKPDFVKIEPEVVYIPNKVVGVVARTDRREPFEIRLWGFGTDGSIVVLSRQWDKWVESTRTEIHRPCHREIIPRVLDRAFQAGNILGRGSSLRIKARPIRDERLRGF